MHCVACSLELNAEDNYCRRCGAAVRVVAVEPLPQAGDVVRIGPSTPALFANLARPLAAGMAVVAAGALARLAARSAWRGVAGAAARPRMPVRSAGAVVTAPRAPRAGRGGQMIEVFWYRRTLTDE